MMEGLEGLLLQVGSHAQLLHDHKHLSQERTGSVLTPSSLEFALPEICRSTDISPLQNDQADCSVRLSSHTRWVFTHPF